ncbi:MAG: class I SAM-dependent methyltransferase [Chloroflexi bacterium]|nr:class I SAM-dependent methyltransferase [Chloroflexota bacterium]
MIDVKCNLCGRDEYKVRFPATMTAARPQVDAFSCTNPGYGEHAQIVQCQHCGYVYANPRWPAEAILDAYTAVEDETYVQERIGRELTFRKHLQAMEKHVGAADGRSILDIGAYIGVFVEVAAAAGWEACGVEPSAWAANVAQKQGLNVIHGTQDTPELAGKQFDVITMWDVIEHLSDPTAELEKANHLLKPGGWIAVHTMDVESFMARLMGSRWPWLMDMHLHYFSQDTLRCMLEKCGFEVVWSGAQGRYLRLNYVASRIKAMNGYIGNLTEKVIHGLRLQKMAVPINFGDLFTIYARHPNLYRH